MQEVHAHDEPYGVQWLCGTPLLTRPGRIPIIDTDREETRYRDEWFEFRKTGRVNGSPP